MVIDNVGEALDRAVANGVRTLVVQPTHLMNGFEYNDLADEGFIISVAGKGYFVAPRNNELLRERMLYEMECGIEKAVTSGRNAGLTDDGIIEAVKEYLKEEQE